MLNSAVVSVNAVLWDTLLVYMLVAAGLWFTVRLRFPQLRLFGHMFAVMKGSARASDEGISPFQALATSLAARVGTGNLAGVAVAITLGGPGAIFWMWVIAVLGMATGFVESTLAQLYKVKDVNGEYRGGPAYYIQMGLDKRWLAVSFSVCLLFGYGFVFSAVQANTIGDALQNAYAIEPLHSGIVMTVVTGIIVMGGLRAVARFAELTVPVMGIAYISMTLFIVLANLAEVPAVLALIVKSAFGIDQAAGGFLGAAINLNSSVECAPSKTLKPEFCPCTDEAGLVIGPKLPDSAASICDPPSISSSLHSKSGTSIPDRSTAAHWLLNR